MAVVSPATYLLRRRHSRLLRRLGRWPTRLRAAGDWHTYHVAPLRPGAVVVLHVAKAQQVFEHKPGVAAPLADAAIGDRSASTRQMVLLAVEFFQFASRFERAVFRYGLRPWNADRSGNMSASQCPFLGIVGHVQQFASVFAGRAHIDQRLAALAVFEHFVAEGANR